MSPSPDTQDHSGRRDPAGRVPPHDLQAEESLLGAMMLSAEAIAAAAGTVTASDFYKPGHGHDDREPVAKAAEGLANSFWSVRNQFEFIAPVGTLQESLDLAVASQKKPFMISDMGDNPTAGGAGDVTWTLREILQRPEFKTETGPALIYASIPGPALVEAAIAAGVGGTVDALAGATVDDRYAPPIRLKGKVTALVQGDQHAETEVVVQIGSVSVIVTKKRKPYHHELDFTRLGMNPREADVVVVKIGYLVPELYDMRGDWIMALTPGGVDQDLMRLPFNRIERPMFPFDEDMADPDLRAKFVPRSGSSTEMSH
jgi:microcystin degradation protein MlrC